MRVGSPQSKSNSPIPPESNNGAVSEGPLGSSMEILRATHNCRLPSTLRLYRIVRRPLINPWRGIAATVRAQFVDLWMAET